MFILDTMLVGGLRFVFDKIAAAVEAEMNDETVLREHLLAAQMRLELGEITEEAFAAIEADVVAGLRVIRAPQGGEPAALSPADYRITGVDASFEGDEHEPR